MPKVTSSQNNLNAGEFSNRALGRFDIAKYANGAKILENFIINQLGGASFRPGTRYVAETKDSSKASRLIPFQYSADQDYVLEMGDLYLRFFNNDSSVVTNTSFDSYYKLMCHFNGTDGTGDVIDEIGKTMTKVGTAQLDDAQTKFGSSASLLLDGDSDAVTTPDHVDFYFDGDFTVDCWIRFNGSIPGAGTTQAIFSQYNAGGDKQQALEFNGDNGITFYNYNSGNVVNFNQGGVAGWVADTWYHVAIVRNGNDYNIYRNGTSVANTTDSDPLVDVDSVFSIGRRPTNNDHYFNGWIDEFRVSKGIARWTADFSASLPTTEYSPIASSEIATPYLEADIFDVHCAQNNDVMYLVHPDYAPRKLSRTSATSFELSLVSFIRGPFLDTNITTTTITPSADTGNAVTLTASAAAFHYDADDGDPDEQLQVGSLWRIKDGVVKLTAVNSATEAVGNVQTEPDGTAGDLNTGPGAVTDWAEGAFSAYRGYPSAITFHEQRLYYANTEHEPQKFWGSVIQAYDNFDEGAAAADDAVIYEVATEQRNAIQWLSSGSKALQIGTVGGTISAITGNSEPITPSNPPLISRDTNYGVANLMPKRISSFVYYAQRDLNKLRELSYSFNFDAHISNDMTLLAEHILKDGGGVVDLDHQQSPNDRIWCVREDGQIAVLTRNPEQEVMGWCRIIAGDDAQGAGVFESVAVIPKASADDQIWVIAKRNINGSTKRFIEFFTPEDFDEDWDAIQVDCSLTLDNPKTITGATSANPVVITSASHGFSNGDYVKINGVVGMTELNGNIYKVAEKTDDTFELTTVDDVDVDGTAYTDYISGGEARKGVTAISGLSHLEGETVSVQVDGYLPATETYVVSGGAITLSARAYVVHAGLPYTGTIQLLKLSDGSATGTGQTKMRRIYKITLRVNRTQGLSVGKSLTTLDMISYDDTSLFSGDIPKVFQTSWDRGDEIYITQSKPLPASLLAIVIQSELEEG